jgi:hypothetical protein
MARKTKLNEEMIKEIADCISIGMSYAATAGAVGVTPETFQNWLNWGKSGEKDLIYSRFLAEVRSAESRLMYDCLTKLRKAADCGKSESVRWLLERRFPQDFGRKNSLELNATTQNTNINLNQDMDLDRIRADFLKRLTPKEVPPCLDITESKGNF